MRYFFWVLGLFFFMCIFIRKSAATIATLANWKAVQKLYGERRIMYELLETARQEGMTFTLGDNEQVLVKGDWKTPNARTLRNALTKQKPVVMAWLRDITSYVGETITADVWFALQQRTAGQGWEIEAVAVKGGVRITTVKAPGVPDAALDPAKDYVLDNEGNFVEVEGGFDWRPALESLTVEQPTLIDVPAKRVYA